MKTRASRKSLNWQKYGGIAAIIAIPLTIALTVYQVRSSNEPVASVASSVDKTIIVTTTPSSNAEAYSYSTNTTCQGSNVSSRLDAYRCFSDKTIYDPCFLDQNVTENNFLTCPSYDPAKDLHLSIPVLDRAKLQEQPSSVDKEPWKFETKSGDICLASSGAVNTYADDGVTFYCLKGGHPSGAALNTIDKSLEPWRAEFGKSFDGPFQSVDIVKAWL